MASESRVFRMPFASVYPLYVAKAAKKGRTRGEVDRVVTWLTGYTARQLQRAVASGVDLEAFFADAPRMNPDARLVTGVVCGVRVEDVADPLLRKIRRLDKLVDELARGKELASVLRERPRGAASAGGRRPAAGEVTRPGAPAPRRGRPGARARP